MYEYAKNNFEDFVCKHNNTIEEGIKAQEIEFSDVVCYDEQYVLENNEWVYKMMTFRSQYQIHIIHLKLSEKKISTHKQL